jgi:integrase/recombinase XerD
MNSTLFSMPVLLRLLYSTGIRIGEALSLTEEDINLAENYLRVKDSKNGKHRIIPISNSLVSVCKVERVCKLQKSTAFWKERKWMLLCDT